MREVGYIGLSYTFWRNFPIRTEPASQLGVFYENFHSYLLRVCSTNDHVCIFLKDITEVLILRKVSEPTKDSNPSLLVHNHADRPCAYRIGYKSRILGYWKPDCNKYMWNPWHLFIPLQTPVMTVRVRKAQDTDAPYQLRYIGQPELGDRNRPTLVRSSLDIACTPHVVEFLTEMGFRVDFEYITKGLLKI